METASDVRLDSTIDELATPELESERVVRLRLDSETHELSRLLLENENDDPGSALDTQTIDDSKRTASRETDADAKFDAWISVPVRSHPESDRLKRPPLCD
jgi:hypothetical protein